MADQSETNKKVASRMLDEMFNLGRPAVIDEVCSKNVLVHVPDCVGDLKGMKAFKEFLNNFLDAYSDIHLHEEDIHAEKDLVDVHATLNATHIGTFYGVAATGEDVTLEPLFTFKFSPEGKIVEHWEERMR